MPLFTNIWQRVLDRVARAVEQYNTARPDSSHDVRQLPNAPVGVPETFREHVDLMFDLQVLAFMTETTRVSSFKLARDVSSAVYPESGIKTPFHALSHHGEDPKNIAEFAKLNQYHVSTVAPFLEKLKQLVAAGATVILLHHVPKDDDSSEGFGSVFIINCADFGWNIARKGGSYASEEATTLKIQNTKTKMGDYFQLKVRPRLKTKGEFEVINEVTESKEKWDRDVNRFKRLFPEDDWIEKRELRKAAMNQGMSRARFKDIFDSCLDQGLLLLRNSGKGLKQCKLA